MISPSPTFNSAKSKDRKITINTIIRWLFILPVCSIILIGSYMLIAYLNDSYGKIGNIFAAFAAASLYLKIGWDIAPKLKNLVIVILAVLLFIYSMLSLYYFLNIGNGLFSYQVLTQFGFLFGDIAGFYYFYNKKDSID